MVRVPIAWRNLYERTRREVQGLSSSDNAASSIEMSSVISHKRCADASLALERGSLLPGRLAASIDRYFGSYRVVLFGKR